MKVRLVAFAVLAVVVSCLSVNSAGGGKKKDAGVGTVEVYKAESGKYRYRIKNDEGKTIAMPLPQMGWDTKADVLKALDEVKAILTKGATVDVKDAPLVKKDAKDKDKDKK